MQLEIQDGPPSAGGSAQASGSNGWLQYASASGLVLLQN